MNVHAPAGPARRLQLSLAAFIFVLGWGWTAQTQEQGHVHDTPNAAAAALPVPAVDPAYLDPLKALSGDEVAFVDQLWAMGNEEFKIVETLQGELGQARTEEAFKAKSEEIAQHIARLEALSALGLQTFDHSAPVHNFRGTVLYDAKGEQVEGVNEWLKAVSLDSDYSDPHNNLGMHYFHVGHYELGFQHMDRALELDPKNADYCFNMAQNYLIYRPQSEKIRGWDSGRIYKEAMKLSKKATKLAPDDYEILEDYAVNFIAAENFGLEPDWKASTKAWVSAREKASTDVQRFFTWLNEGRAWRTLENNKEAKRCFEAALTIIPGNEVATRLLAEVSGEKSAP